MSGTTALPASYAQELTERSRVCGVLITLIAAVAVPAWWVFDRALEPEQAGTFLALRLACDVPILVVLWLLWRAPLGRRHPSPLTFLVLVVVQSEVAWMVARASSAREFYLLGFTLPVFGCGCLLVGHTGWTAAVVGSSWVTLAAAAVTAPSPLPSRDLVAAAMYLATASVIALVAHAHRNRLTRRELEARAGLEQEHARAEVLLQELERLSHEDPLTGLANRRRWDAELETACARAAARGTTVSVLLVDVDLFKSINDRFGHAGGDDALRHVALALRDRVGGAGLVARLGGDELGVLLDGVSAEQAAALAEQLRTDALQAGPLPGTGVELTLSVGVCTAAGAGTIPRTVMALADRELYRAKTTRNSVSAITTGTSALPAPREPVQEPVRR